MLDLATFTVGTHSLVVGSVLLTVPLNLDGSYVDGGSFVVFIFDTTQTTVIRRGVSTLRILFCLRLSCLKELPKSRENLCFDVSQNAFERLNNGESYCVFGFTLAEHNVVAGLIPYRPSRMWWGYVSRQNVCHLSDVFGCEFRRGEIDSPILRGVG